VIKIGRTQTLRILRLTKDGSVLGDDDAVEVLLPRDECPKDANEGGRVHVFVHPDKDGKPIATTTPPKAEVGEFALMKVKAIRGAGAHMEWGIEPALLVPHEEQRKAMEEGRWYIVHVGYDEEEDRLFGSTRVEDHLDNTELEVKKGDKVDLLVFSKSELGMSVIVNHKHQGLIHMNEIFKPVSIGDRIIGYVKTVREDNKLDITLQPIGYRQYIDGHMALLAKRLQNGGGFLPLTDKSSAEEIHAEFGISKKAFKKALGALYKERVVRIEEAGIVWVG